MTLSPSDWHHRFQIQARWTRDLRQYLYKRLDLPNLLRVLEVGCGTGAILSGLQDVYKGNLYGVDINRDFLDLAQLNSSSSLLIQGDALTLPFKGAIFDLSLCHYLLLWMSDPGNTIKEMSRVTRSGGWILALAEPDYGGRIDYPDELSQIGFLQSKALQQGGADPEIGRKLSSLFHWAGLESIETGVLGGQWSSPPNPEDLEDEWTIIMDDLHQLREFGDLQNNLKELDYAAWSSGQRTLYVPTFYAIGKVIHK